MGVKGVQYEIHYQGGMVKSEIHCQGGGYYVKSEIHRYYVGVKGVQYEICLGFVEETWVSP